MSERNVSEPEIGRSFQISIRAAKNTLTVNQVQFVSKFGMVEVGNLCIVVEDQSRDSVGTMYEFWGYDHGQMTKVKVLYCGKIKYAYCT